MVKIPTEITEFFDLKKGDKIKFTVEMPKEKDGEVGKKFEIVKNDPKTA